MPFLTEQQSKAISFDGNLLMSAGAGSGKTRTLIERCVHWLLDSKNQNSIDRVLIVTFTEAAAEEIKRRLTLRLTEAATKHPENRHIQEQLIRMDYAAIGTLHSFCYRLIREHFFQLELDPKNRVGDPAAARLIFDQTFQEHLGELLDSNQRSNIENLLEHLQGDGPEALRSWLFDLQTFSQSLDDPDKWIEQQKQLWANPTPELWKKWLRELIPVWSKRWTDHFSKFPEGNGYVDQTLLWLVKLPQTENYAESFLQFDVIIDALKQKKKKGTTREAIEGFLGERDFLQPLLDDAALADDWSHCRKQMIQLLNIFCDFREHFARAKRSAGILEFSDLEQLTLRLLRDPDGAPSQTAIHWQKRFDLVFVDEYQDINPAQDAVIRLLARPEGNRFLVGDLKQSIYAFRLASPEIFIQYARDWNGSGAGRTLHLSENFRSHAKILDFVNAFFTKSMRGEAALADYDEHAKLIYPSTRLAPENRSPRVALTVIVKPEDEAEDSDTLDLNEREAAVLGAELRRLHDAGIEVESNGACRPARWSDMVILLRSPAMRVQRYVQQLAKAGVPVLAPPVAFYQSLEVYDVLSTCQIVDNPLQDIPLLAVLRSPFGRFSTEQLAEIRAPQTKGFFLDALKSAATRSGVVSESTQSKAAAFLGHLQKWRRFSRETPLSEWLERVLDESEYGDPDATSSVGQNLRRLLRLAKDYDSAGNSALPRFILFLQTQQEEPPRAEPTALGHENLVRIMSIHQSKGLEFPIVAVAGLGKPFNLRDTSDQTLFDRSLGICPMVTSPETLASYPSLAHWLAWQKQAREIRTEELRLLYVAMTRASDWLLLSGTASSAELEKWEEMAAGASTTKILKPFDWLMPWIAKESNGATGEGGSLSNIQWRCVRDVQPVEMPAVRHEAVSFSADSMARWQNIVDWKYPFSALSDLPAKISVSGLRRLHDQETPAYVRFEESSDPENTHSELTPAAFGDVHHRFLELVNLDAVQDQGKLKGEIDGLLKRQLFTEKEAETLRVDWIANFWCSRVGREFLSHRSDLHREIPFTVRVSQTALQNLFPEGSTLPLNEDDFVVLQGIVDLAVVLPNEIWILDFKTNEINGPEVLAKKTEFYRSQLLAYALAMEAVYQRPVTRALLHFLEPNKSVDVR